MVSRSERPPPNPVESRHVPQLSETRDGQAYDGIHAVVREEPRCPAPRNGVKFQAQHRQMMNWRIFNEYKLNNCLIRQIENNAKLFDTFSLYWIECNFLTYVDYNDYCIFFPKTSPAIPISFSLDLLSASLLRKIRVFVQKREVCGIGLIPALSFG